MDPIANAALTSWSFRPLTFLSFVLAAVIYLRGWRRIRLLVRTPSDVTQLAAFGGGLATLWIALDSPLDAFDSFYLSAHMAQHLLLMMIAPPLILLGRPTVPLLRGLPKSFVKEALGPFLAAPAMKRIASILTSPPLAWGAFSVSTIFWHLPKFYELALADSFWHGVQHASFFWTGILFWWPIIEPTPAKPRWPRWTKIPYLLFADILNTALAAFFVFSGQLLYPSYAAVHLGSMQPQDDQTLAGLIMWVPGSLVYLVPAFVFVVKLFSGETERKVEPVQRRKLSTPRRGMRSKLATSRRAAQVFMLLLAIALIADGFWGPQAASINFAGVLPWIHWRALSILSLILVGNLFCMVCPFVLVRDLGRKILPAKFRWPRQLRNKWISALLLLVYLWAYEVFDLWESPFLTASLILGYFLAAVVIDGIFRGASFCKYVCPIGQFHFLSSLVSPREVRVKSQSVCRACQTYDCIRGNSESRGCELDLFQPKKVSNLDCTFCLDCVKACPHDNVGILPVVPARTLSLDPYRSSLGRLSKRNDLALLALIFVFGALVNAAGMTAPIMMLEHRWRSWLGPHSMPLILGSLILAGVVLAPAALVLACVVANRSVSPLNFRLSHLARRLILTFVPLGVSIWCSHLLYHLVTGWDAPLRIFQERVTASQGQFPMPSVPEWLTPLQILVLDAGLLLTLYLSWRIARSSGSTFRQSLALVVPWSSLGVALYSVAVWLVFQPMEMRGMMN